MTDVRPLTLRFPWFTLYGRPDRPGRLARLRCTAAMLVHEAVELAAGSSVAHSMRSAARFQIGAPSITVPASQRNKLFLTTVEHGFPDLYGELVDGRPGVELRVYASGAVGDTYESIFNPGPLVELRLSNPATGDWEPVATGTDGSGSNANVLRVAVVADDPGYLGGTFDSDEWTVAALSSVPTTGDLSLLAVIGTDPEDMSGASTGLFRHAGGGVFERVRTWDLSDAGRWLLAMAEMAPGSGGAVVWLYLVGGSTLGYSSLAAGDLTAGHMIDIDSGVVSLKKRRIIPTITAGLFEGDGIADCMELVPGDPAGVARPTVTAIDGVDLAAPRVAGVKNPLTASLSGFWEVFEVGATGYLQPSDFAAPQPDVGDFYFERVTELNGQWTDDALFGSTPVYVGQGNVWGGRVVWTFGDGLDCNFAPSQVDVSEVYGLANIATSGDYEDLSGAPTLAAVATSGDYQDLDNLPTLGTAAAANSTDFATASHVHAGEDITSGTVAAARLGSGTPSASNFLRGDGSWQTPAATVDVVSNVASARILGRQAAGSGDSEELTAAQARSVMQFDSPALPSPAVQNEWVPLFFTATAPGSNTLGSTASNANNIIRYVPVFIGKRVGISGIGFEVSTGNAGGSAVIRVGFHADNAGRPGTVAVQGTASAAAAAKEVTFTEVFLDPGWWWLAFGFQSLDTAGTNPAVRTAAISNTGSRASIVTGSSQTQALSATISGALADNPTVSTANSLVNALFTFVRVSTP